MPKGVYRRKRLPLKVRFWKKVQKTRTCWLWTGSRTGTAGYGNIFVGYKNGKRITGLAHRLTYKWAKGPIPKRRLLDHKCRKRRCVRPSHLRPVTHKQNSIENSVSPAAKAVNTNRCVHGHTFTKTNTYYRKDGHGRMCLTCVRIRVWHYKRGIPVNYKRVSRMTEYVTRSGIRRRIGG